MKSIPQWIALRNTSVAQLADDCYLPVERLKSIIAGRRQPAVNERERIAAALEVLADQIDWTESCVTDEQRPAWPRERERGADRSDE